MISSLRFCCSCAQVYSWLCRVYRAIKPACTHSYVIRNATVAELLLDEMGHDLVKPIDLGLISLIEAKGEQIPMYVMLPPPVTQLWRTRKRKVRSCKTHCCLPTFINAVKTAEL